MQYGRLRLPYSLAEGSNSQRQLGFLIVHVPRQTYGRRDKLCAAVAGSNLGSLTVHIPVGLVYHVCSHPTCSFWPWRPWPKL